MTLVEFVGVNLGLTERESTALLRAESHLEALVAGEFLVALQALAIERSRALMVGAYEEPLADGVRAFRTGFAAGVRQQGTLLVEAVELLRELRRQHTRKEEEDARDAIRE